MRGPQVTVQVVDGAPPRTLVRSREPLTLAELVATARVTAARHVDHDPRFPGVMALHAYTDNS